MIKGCKAICISGVHQRKGGLICGEPATHMAGDQPCCWLHYQVVAANSRTLHFELQLQPCSAIAAR